MSTPRTLTRHAVTPADKRITITADERDPNAGNMSHHYRLSYDALGNGYVSTHAIDFQQGPVGEVGMNGITNEALLDIVLDRLEGAQEGPFACDYNADAINLIKAGLERLKDRTRDREARGVEGVSKA
jgi:hypothetical protein